MQKPTTLQPLTDWELPARYTSVERYLLIMDRLANSLKKPKRLTAVSISDLFNNFNRYILWNGYPFQDFTDYFSGYLKKGKGLKILSSPFRRITHDEFALMRKAAWDELSSEDKHLLDYTINITFDIFHSPMTDLLAVSGDESIIRRYNKGFLTEKETRVALSDECLINYYYKNELKEDLDWKNITRERAISLLNRTDTLACKAFNNNNLQVNKLKKDLYLKLITDKGIKLQRVNAGDAGFSTISGIKSKVINNNSIDFYVTSLSNGEYSDGCYIKEINHIIINETNVENLVCFLDVLIKVKPEGTLNPFIKRILNDFKISRNKLDNELIELFHDYILLHEYAHSILLHDNNPTGRIDVFVKLEKKFLLEVLRKQESEDICIGEFLADYYAWSELSLKYPSDLVKSALKTYYNFSKSNVNAKVHPKYRHRTNIMNIDKMLDILINTIDSFNDDITSETIFIIEKKFLSAVRKKYPVIDY